jgi:hypothetical protein
MNQENKDLEPEELKILKEKKKYLDDWKSNLKDVNDALPFVEENIENTQFVIDAISNLPTVSGDKSILGFRDTIKRDYDFTLSAFPPIPKYDISQLNTASSITTSGTVSMFSYFQSFDSYNDPNIQKYIVKLGKDYQNLQEAQSRPKKVQDLVTKLNNPNTAERFSKASKAYTLSKANINSLTEAGSEFRNLLYGIKGDLLNLARVSPNEKISWQEMANRLSKSGPNDEPLNELISQETYYKTLTDKLSQIAKDRQHTTIEQISQIWSEILDFIYTVLGLIKLP